MGTIQLILTLKAEMVDDRNVLLRSDFFVLSSAGWPRIDSKPCSHSTWLFQWEILKRPGDSTLGKVLIVHYHLVVDTPHTNSSRFVALCGPIPNLRFWLSQCARMLRRSFFKNLGWFQSVWTSDCVAFCRKLQCANICQPGRWWPSPSSPFWDCADAKAVSRFGSKGERCWH